MYFVTAHPPPATGVETSSASVQLPDPNIYFSTPTCSSKLPIESQTVYLLQAHWIYLLVHLLVHLLAH